MFCSIAGNQKSKKGNTRKRKDKEDDEESPKAKVNYDSLIYLNIL